MNAHAVQVREVGLRDGLQMVPFTVDTETKLAWIAQAYRAGLRHMEVTSFVPARVMPQFADAEIVMAGAKTFHGLDTAVLALNPRGAERSLAAEAATLVFVLSASCGHSDKNAGRSPEQALQEFAGVARQCQGLPVDKRPRLVGAIATAFGCTLEGRIEPGWVRELAGRLAQAGADEIALADTVGYANPAQVRTLFSQVAADLGELPLSAHFHNTRGLGLANVVAALEAGVRRFDAAVGGLGGCPFAPGASGNIATEDLVFMLHEMGLPTGIDLPGLLALREAVSHWLPGVPLHGSLARAGLPRTIQSAH
ncbi:MAG: yngG [Burkholderia sp.]|nr:yngG [Burkholderia sp.]